MLDSLPPPKISPATQPPKLLVPENRAQASLGHSLSVQFRSPQQPTATSLPSRPSEPYKGYPNGLNSSAVKPGYQPITSANDPRLTYTLTGSISNPLNIRPSRHPPTAPPKSVSRASPPPPGPKRKVVVGNGWPHNKQTNGHATVASAISVSPPISKLPLPPVPPLTPDSTRSSRTPPGLSGLAPYSSPSPPGFLHSSSGPKSAAPVDQGRFGLFSQPSSSTPQIKYGESLVVVTGSGFLQASEINDWATPSLPQSPVSVSAQSVQIQAPRPIAPPSAASTVLQYTPQSLGPIGSNSSTPSHDTKGKKRALTFDVDVDADTRPRKRALAWPCQDPVFAVQVKSDDDAGIHSLALSSDGERLAAICHDCTIRIWNMAGKVETARLAQNGPIMAVAWMSDDMGVVSLARDGVVSKWTRTVGFSFYPVVACVLMYLRYRIRIIGSGPSCWMRARRTRFVLRTSGIGLRWRFRGSASRCGYGSKVGNVCGCAMTADCRGRDVATPTVDFAAKCNINSVCRGRGGADWGYERWCFVGSLFAFWCTGSNCVQVVLSGTEWDAARVCLSQGQSVGRLLRLPT